MASALAFAVLLADTIRRVYAVGRELNDHFVTAVVTGCMGFYLLICQIGPPEAMALGAGGMVGIWGLFFSLHRNQAPPAMVRLALGLPSQLAYAFALWGGLLVVLRLPYALSTGAHWFWPGAWLAIPLALTLAGFTHTHATRYRVRTHTVEGLPLRLVQLSDLHASPMMHRAELDPLVSRVNALAPDLVVVTGDLVMPFSEEEHGYLVEALANIEAPVYACPGNHDLPVLEQLRAELAKVGATLLVDESAKVSNGEVELVGLNFHWKKARNAMEQSLANLGERGKAFRVLLAHDPRLGAWLEGGFDLALSGHTHGGQVGLNMFGIPFSFLRLFGVRDQGWFSIPGGRHYVHSGNWLTGLPPRLGVGPEIALFCPDLKPAPRAARGESPPARPDPDRPAR